MCLGCVWWWGEDGGCVLPGYFARVYLCRMPVDQSGDCGGGGGVGEGEMQG